MLNGTSSHMLIALSSHQFEEEAVNDGAASSIVSSRSVQQFLIGSPPGLKRGTDVFDRDDSISVKFPDYEFNDDIPPASGRRNIMQKVMSAMSPIVQPSRDIVYNTNSASMVVDDGELNLVALFPRCPWMTT
jgi:hypothetical protein